MAIKLDNFARAVSMLLLALISCGIAHGQRRDRTVSQFQHTGWTAKEGAPGSAWGLAQTADGYLWIGTPTGLYRFDGIQFELYQPSSGERFLSDYIQTLKATPDGGLWIGFNNGRAAFLNNGRITSYGKPEGLPGASVDQFVLDRNGVVWAATGNGLGRFDGSRWQLIGRDWGYSGKVATAAFLDREGTLWVASEDALFFLSRGSREFRKCADHLGDTTSIGQTPDGTLWLSVLHPAQLHGKLIPEWTFRAIRPTPVLPAGGQVLPSIMEIDAVSSLLIDHAGSIWIATTDGLLRVAYPERLKKNTPLRLDKITAQAFRQKDGLTSDFVDRGTTIEDAQGDIWLATQRGLDRFRESNVVPITTDLYRAILVAGDHGDAWTSVVDFPQISLVHLRGLTTRSRPFPAILSAGYRDSRGVIWLGGPAGLWDLEADRLVRHPLPEAVTTINGQFDVAAITGDTKGGLFVSINGVYHWANGVWTYLGNRDDRLKSTPIALLADSAGRLWLGNVGNNLALLAGDRVKKFSAADGLQVVDIQSIYEHAGHIWVGGGRGLAFFKNNRFQSLTSGGNAGFIGVSGIVETANGDLWVNATPGIFHIPASEIERAIKEPSYRVRYDLFDVLDGLNGNALQVRPIPTAVESSDGLLWFETTAGVVQINPDHLLRNTLAPSVFIRSIDSDGIVHSASGAIDLPPRTTNLHITYVAPNLSIPERVHYRYELEGSDHNWLDAETRREAFYTNLGPGHYRFHVVACNENGVWNNVGANVSFTIAPAWFQTYWFFALCSAIALLIVWILYRMRVQQVSKAMSVRFDERLSERTRLARDLHDTLLQTIQASKYVADSALRRSMDSNPVRGSLEELSAWLGQAIDEGRAAVYSLRISATVTNDLAEGFRRAIDECRMQGSLEASLSVIGEVSEMHPIARDEVYRIGHEAIHNACVHSQATQLKVELTYADDLILRVYDNGVGIDSAIVSEGKEGHFGLRGMRERASRILAKLTVESSPGTGTEIKLVVPGGIIYRSKASDGRMLSGIKSLLKQMGLTSNSNDL